MAMLERIIKTKFRGHVMTEGQCLFLDTSRDKHRPSYMFDMTVTEIIGGSCAKGKLAKGLIDKDTIIRAFPGDAMAFLTRTPPINKCRYNFDLSFLEAELNKLGIGGLANTLKIILEGVFGSESLPLPYCSSLSLARRKVKGVALYGEDGTQFTLLARNLHKILGTMEPKIIKYSMSSKDIISLFGEAIQDDMIHRCYRFFGKQHCKRNRLHLFIMEDINHFHLADKPSVISALKQRPATLATMIDGLDNILIIGTTKRFNQVHPSLLRPGRFEFHVKLDLPNNRERTDILKMHTRVLILEKCLKEGDLDIQELALWTHGYTAGSLEFLVLKALNKAKKRVSCWDRFYATGTKVCMEDFYFELQPRYIKIILPDQLRWVVDQLK